jgi:nucleotide-binding universal stress UspA family protein
VSSPGGAVIRKILIAVDGEPLSVPVAARAAELAHALGAEIALVQVVESPLDVQGDTGIAKPELFAMIQKQCKALLQGFRRRLHETTRATEFLLAGPPATGIVKAATHGSADMVVIGSHGRSGLERIVLGSVADAVIRNAPCPVLVVRAKA